MMIAGVLHLQGLLAIVLFIFIGPLIGMAGAFLLNVLVTQSSNTHVRTGQKGHSSPSRSLHVSRRPRHTGPMTDSMLSVLSLPCSSLQDSSSRLSADMGHPCLGHRNAAWGPVSEAGRWSTRWQKRLRISVRTRDSVPRLQAVPFS